MRFISLALCLLLMASSAFAQRQFDISNQTANKKSSSQIQNIRAHKNGAMSRIGLDLAELSTSYRNYTKQRILAKDLPPFSSDNPIVQVVSGDMVVVDAVATGNPADLLAEMNALGLQNGETYGRYVSGVFPIDQLDQLAGSAFLAQVRPAANTSNVGLVTSRGDAVMITDQVRSLYGIDGSGITIGTLSDSYDCLGGAAADVASNDLPAGVIVLDDSTCPDTDEGRGMMQLIHDVAPGSTQAFHTANNGQAAFANGIIDLANAGSDIIVDDIIYLAEPMYQDGIIAQAVDIVKASGSAYYSSAGNQGRDAYSSAFQSSGVAGVFGGDRHDFDPGPGVDDLQTITLGTGTTIFVLQWSEPAFSISGPPGSASDMDIVLYLSNGAFIGLGGFNGNLGGDPIEVFGVTNSGPPVPVQMGIELFGGPAPADFKYLFFGPSAFGEFATNSGTVYGHAAANGAQAIGASAWFNTPLFNGFINAPLLNGFSSVGPVPVLFDTAGNPINELRAKPELVGPDGTNTTFFGGDLSFPVPGTSEPDGFPNFFGTSAAAPHVAAAAALVLQTDASLSPDEINNLLAGSAVDMDDSATPGFDAGFDNATGAGLVNALGSVEAAAAFGNKFFICFDNSFDTHTIAVKSNKLNKFLAQGNKFGPCDDPNPVADAAAFASIIDRIEDVIDDNPGDCADKVEDALSGVETALDEFLKPDLEACIGNIEGAVGDLEAAVEDGDCNDSSVLLALINDLTDVALGIALDAINNDNGNINDALDSLTEGDEERNDGKFKDAVAKYKDVLGNL